MAMKLQELLDQCKGGIGMTERNVPKIMSGAKTQTRRIIKIKRSSDCPEELPDDSLSSEILEWRQQDGQWFGLHEYRTIALAGRVHQVGDRLYVKEALAKHEDVLGGDSAVYKTDKEFVRPTDTSSSLNSHREWASDDGKPWKNKVIPARYMPRSAARTFIEITNVKCERIQDISVEDIQAEGCRLLPTELFQDVNTGSKLKKRFKQLWNDTNGKGAWDRNDWTFAYTFKIVEPS